MNNKKNFFLNEPLFFSGPYNSNELLEKYDINAKNSNNYYLVLNITPFEKRMDLATKEVLESLSLNYNIPMFELNKNDMNNLVKDLFLK